MPLQNVIQVRAARTSAAAAAKIAAVIRPAAKSSTAFAEALLSSLDVGGSGKFNAWLARKQMRVFEEDGLSAELLEPFRGGASPNEHSQIQVRFNGRKVLEIRWDRAGAFKSIHFEPGEWERVLIDLPEPIPFD
jgi:hypothetical protein